jgi:hypothetical protein
MCESQAQHDPAGSSFGLWICCGRERCASWTTLHTLLKVLSTLLLFVSVSSWPALAWPFGTVRYQVWIIRSPKVSNICYIVCWIRCSVLYQHMLYCLLYQHMLYCVLYTVQCIIPTCRTTPPCLYALFPLRPFLAHVFGSQSRPGLHVYICIYYSQCT